MIRDDDNAPTPHHDHAITIAGARAALRAGHIDQKTHDMMIRGARGALKKRKETQTQNAEPPSNLLPNEPRVFGRAYDKQAAREFGSIAPPNLDDEG